MICPMKSNWFNWESFLRIVLVPLACVYCSCDWSPQPKKSNKQKPNPIVPASIPLVSTLRQGTNLVCAEHKGGRGGNAVQSVVQ